MPDAGPGRGRIAGSNAPPVSRKERRRRGASATATCTCRISCGPPTNCRRLRRTSGRCAHVRRSRAARRNLRYRVRIRPRRSTLFGRTARRQARRMNVAATPAAAVPRHEHLAVGGDAPGGVGGATVALAHPGLRRIAAHSEDAERRVTDDRGFGVFAPEIFMGSPGVEKTANSRLDARRLGGGGPPAISCSCIAATSRQVFRSWQPGGDRAVEFRSPGIDGAPALRLRASPYC